MPVKPILRVVVTLTCILVFLFSGVVSYSLYLLHAPIIEIARRLTLDVAGLDEGGPALFVIAGLTCLLAAPAAWLSFQLVERPFLARRERERRAIALAS